MDANGVASADDADGSGGGDGAYLVLGECLVGAECAQLTSLLLTLRRHAEHTLAAHRAVHHRQQLYRGLCDACFRLAPLHDAADAAADTCFASSAWDCKVNSRPFNPSQLHMGEKNAHQRRKATEWYSSMTVPLEAEVVVRVSHDACTLSYYSRAMQYMYFYPRMCMLPCTPRVRERISLRVLLVWYRWSRGSRCSGKPPCVSLKPCAPEARTGTVHASSYSHAQCTQ